jgi:hypothetical protein
MEDDQVGTICTDNAFERAPLFAQIEGPEKSIVFPGYLWSAGDVQGDGIDDLILQTVNRPISVLDYCGPINHLKYRPWCNTSYLLMGRRDRDLHYNQTKIITYRKCTIEIGDTNGDDLADIASFSDYYDVIDDEGSHKIEIRYGNQGGVPENPSTVIACVPKDADSGEVLWLLVDGIGDINGDGFDDLFVLLRTIAVEKWTITPLEIQIYYGSNSGLPNTPSIRHVISKDDVERWARVSYLRHADINGDARSDILLCLLNASSNEISYPLDEVAIHYGSTTGISFVPDRRLVGDWSDHSYAVLHPTLDVNGDGFADIAVESVQPISSVSTRMNETTRWYHLTIYTGSADGLVEEPSLVEKLGNWTNAIFADINGDGLDDLVKIKTVSYISPFWIPEEGPRQYYRFIFSFHINTGGYFSTKARWTYTLSNFKSPLYSFDVGDFDGDAHDDLALSFLGTYEQNYYTEPKWRWFPGKLIVMWGAGIQNISRPLHVDGGPCLYAGYKAYDFKVNMKPNGDASVRGVRLTLDPDGADVTVEWNGSPSSNLDFVPYNGSYVKLLSSKDDIKSDDKNKTTWAHFLLYFDWEWPHEEPCDAVIEIFNISGGVRTFVQKECFYVENDLDFYGELTAIGERQGPLADGGWVAGGERVTFSGPRVVYQGTTDVFPPERVFNAVVQDDDGDFVEASVPPGVPIRLSIAADAKTDPNESYTLTLQDLPGTAKLMTQPVFNLRVDADEPVFKNPIPDSEDWIPFLHHRG